MGKTYYWLTGMFQNHEPEANDTDEWALANGFVSVVPVSVDMTAHWFTDKLKEQGVKTRKAIIDAGLTRITPVVLTATATILGLIPLAIGMNINFRVRNCYFTRW